MGPDALVTSRTTVELGPFENDLDDADRDGELCDGLADDWAEVARAGHRNRRIARLDELTAAAETPAVAASWAARRCALTPLDEPAHCVLIERLAAAGDRAGALVVGRDLAARLRAELGVAPGPPVRALLAGLRGPTAAVDGTPGVTRPMFGRAGELAALTAAWNGARDGHGRVVLVTGEAGMGKTRLVGELARRADNAGARVAVGAGVDVGGEAPLAVWQELARALVSVVSVPPEGAGWPSELGRLSPDLAGALGRRAAPPVVAAPELERLRLFDAVLRLVEFAASGIPVLLVAEDLHRADRASLALCAHIGRRLARLPVLFVLTRRDRPTRPEADALVADLAGRGLDVAEIALGPLRSQEVAEVARSVAMLADADLARVVAAADGNPLLAVESTRALAAGSTAPPSSLRAVVRSAMAALSEPARNLAEAVAAAGRTLSAVGDRGVARDRRQRARGARNGVGPPRTGRPRLPSRAARRGGPRRPAGPGGHPSPGGARRRGGGRAGRASGPPRSPATCSAPVATTSPPARWQRAARHARSLGALPEAAAFWGEAVCCDPDDGGLRLELAEAQAGSAAPDEFERAWADALARLAPRRAGRRLVQARADASRPSSATRTASLAAYRRARELLTRRRAGRAAGPVADRPRLDGGDRRRSGPQRAAAGRGGGAHPGAGRRDRRRDRDRAADHRDPAGPVRRVRGAGAAGRGRARPRAAARLRLRGLDLDRVRAGVRG